MPPCKQLGAERYIDSKATNVAEELTKLGGARVVLATVTDAKSMSAAIGGLGVSNIRPVIETYPLERAPEAYTRMMSGKARFRLVLTPGS